MFPVCGGKISVEMCTAMAWIHSVRTEGVLSLLCC